MNKVLQALVGDRVQIYVDGALIVYGELKHRGEVYKVRQLNHDVEFWKSNVTQIIIPEYTLPQIYLKSKSQ